MTGDKLVIIAGVCIFAAAMCRIFDSGSREYGVLIKTVTAAGIAAAVIAGLLPAVEKIEELYEKIPAGNVYLTILLKGLGICYLTQLASDICKDSGEGALAVHAEMAGKTALLIIAIPLFEKTAQLALELIY
ncbi:MAG: stage III sporulation protein AD [Oscillospiraceae bacterium]|nr:stage III sporulation protein AD [Oscillospiraceae bacterium]